MSKVKAKATALASKQNALSTTSAGAPSAGATAMAPPKHVAVIGGGPKAVALAAKAKVLRDLGVKDVHLTIFEPIEIGAAWRGNDGFTDGQQRLCTIAERDIGFPYDNDKYRSSGKDVAAAMRAFSWQAFLLDADENADERPYGYGQWVDAGRRPPKHRDFANYLKWARERTKTPVVKGWVRGLRAKGAQWELTVATSASDLEGSVHTAQLFDGVVVTGTGPTRRVRVTDERKNPDPLVPVPIFNGQDFWQRTEEVRSLLTPMAPEDEYLEEILIVGGGGTAAAILAWLLANGGMNRTIRLLAGQASLHTRVDSVFENKLFSDSDQWNELSRLNQKAFFNRLNRGVVWDTVIDRVSAAERLRIQDARAKRVVIREDGTLWVDLKLGNGKRISAEPALLIDASGFNARWFLSALGAAAPDEETLNDLEESMDEHLAFCGDDWQLPRLHVPMLSSRVGPGFASLMVLGAMADRILGAY